MDTEESSNVSETQQQEEPIMEKDRKVELTEESVKPENPPAAVEEAKQLAVNGHATEVANADEMVVAKNATQEKEEEKIEEKSDPSVVALPESAESSEKLSDPALEAKPESAEQQPIPESKPEPLQTPEPEKPAEAEPEDEQSVVPAVVSQPIETQPPSHEETVTEHVMSENEPHATVEAVLEKEVASEKPAAATIKEAAAEDVKEAEAVVEKQVSSEKPTIKEAAAEGEGVEPPKEASPDQTEPPVEAVTSEQKDAEPQKEDVVPAAGSLSFAILEHEETKNALRISRTLVVLRGLPGSGKSFLAHAIADAFKDQCSVFCADRYGIKPENPKSSTDGYKALDDAVAARCSEDAASSVLMVVDDTNHTHDRLVRLGEIADEHNLIAIFLEPQTEWSRDLTELKKKTSRSLEEAQLEAMRSPLEETSIPLYFGWFLLSSVQEKVKCTVTDFLKTLDTMDAFKKHLADWKAEQEVDLEQYFEATSTLHCTTKFCDYGKADGAKEYAQNPVVKKSYGSAFELSLTALFVTPRTVGFRVALTEEQLLLWPADAEKEAESSSLPPGSRAHITLGCAEGVDPVQTGLDLLQILALQQRDVVEEMALGPLRYYDEGRWMLELREPIGATTCFSSFYARKEVEPTKKEHEKKKKLKCAIL